MKLIILILFVMFTLPAVIHAQRYQSEARKTWVLIGLTERPAQRVYKADLSVRPKYNETWVKWVFGDPHNVGIPGKRKMYAKSLLQFATADCERGRISFESSTFYDGRGRTVPTPFSFLFNRFSEPVLEGTIGSAIWESLCDERLMP